jgi:hypothetical protein
MRRYIVLLLITGIVWAQTDFDKLVLKDGTTYLGEYSKIEGEIVYFKPQNAFAFQPISIKKIKILQLKDGQFIIGSSSDILPYEENQKESLEEYQKLSENYSHDELITFLDQDINFVGNKDFLKYKNSVENLKFKSMIPVYAYSVAAIIGGIDNYNHPEENPENPEIYIGNFAASVVVPLSYYTFNKGRRDKSLYYVVKNYNNLYSEEKLPNSKPPDTWSGGMSFGFQSEKTPVSLFDAYLLFRLNEHQEIFTGFGTIIFGGSLFTGYKHYLNDFSKPSPYMSISYHGGSYFDSGDELIGIFPSLGFSLPMSEEAMRIHFFSSYPLKNRNNTFLNFGIGYVFMQKNTMSESDGKKAFLAPFLNLSFNY